MNLKAKTTVLVIGNNTHVQKLFHNADFKVIYDTRDRKIEPDLICFTGGADVNPVYYKENTLFRTRIDPKRDVIEGLVFEKYLATPKVGICRGGQFLNVFSGGALWQHVNNHVDPHQVIDLLFTKKPLWVSSTHHQMMIPGEGSHLLAMTPTIVTEHMSGKKRDVPKYDPEVLWYPGTNSLCFQPHPEFSIPQGKEHTEYFFKLLKWAFDFPVEKE